MSGIDRIAAERKRQIEVEHWTPEHDDGHANGEITFAAIAYARVASVQAKLRAKYVPEGIPSNWGWPWAPHWWKPNADPIRNLEIAGALIAAEIDRLERMAGEAREAQDA